MRAQENLIKENLAASTHTPEREKNAVFAVLTETLVVPAVRDVMSVDTTALHHWQAHTTPRLNNKDT